MVVRFLGVLNACILSIGFTTNTYAALATADMARLFRTKNHATFRHAFS